MRPLRTARFIVLLAAPMAAAQYRPRAGQRPEDALALRDGQRAILESIALAPQHAMAVLSPEQQEKAAALENDARKQVDEDRAPRGPEGGEGRRGPGGRGRPLEG